jgi:hypothetical protein
MEVNMNGTSKFVIALGVAILIIGVGVYAIMDAIRYLIPKKWRNGPGAGLMKLLPLILASVICACPGVLTGLMTIVYEPKNVLVWQARAVLGVVPGAFSAAIYHWAEGGLVKLLSRLGHGLGVGKSGGPTQ